MPETPKVRAELFVRCVRASVEDLLQSHHVVIYDGGSFEEAESGGSLSLTFERNGIIVAFVAVDTGPLVEGHQNQQIALHKITDGEARFGDITLWNPETELVKAIDALRALLMSD